MIKLEVCIDSAADLQSCHDGEADRIELCSALGLGGLTPSAGFMKLAARSTIPVYAMIRPRAGDFCFNAEEIEVMCEDIAMAQNSGLAGVVLGVSNQQGELDYQALQQLCLAAGDMKKTLHRVIDTLINPLRAVEQAIDLGMDHILSSGGAPSVKTGLALLGKMHDVTAGRIDIMAGAGLTPELALQIHQETGISSFHSSCRQQPPKATDPELVALGFAPPQSHVTSADSIRRYKKILSNQ